MFKKIVGLGFSSTGKNKRDVEQYIQNLVDNGATEFFTGYNPPYWSDKFGFEVSPNGRFSEHEQITDFETLKQIVTQVHKHGFELFINLNAWYYTSVTFPYIEKMIQEFIDLKIDGIICGNIGVLEYLQQIEYKGKINISTIFAVYNTEAIQFLLENYNINKVILSREITLSEIKQLVETFPQTKFEVFGEGDFCRYNNGLCFAEHKYGSRDICTVVVNDLVYHKKIRPDFKKIILSDSKQALKQLEPSVQLIFDQIKTILTKIELGLDLEEQYSTLQQIYITSYNREDLFYDDLESINSSKNTNIITYKKGLDLLLKLDLISDNRRSDLVSLQEYLDKSIKDGYQFYINQIKQKGESNILSEKTKLFYSKGDSLNLYSYIFFSQFKNIETVKFPTRGREANNKLNIIKDTVEKGIVEECYLDGSISPERTHYDLRLLFGNNKLWFRQIKKEE